jgi:hypothetical protein
LKDPSIEEFNKLSGNFAFKKAKHPVEWFGGDCEVEGPWVDGKPHGLCIVQGEHERGVGTFTHGQLHGGPFWLQDNDGYRNTYESMRHEQPVGIKRWYYSNEHSCIANDKKNETPTPGWMFAMRQDMNKDIAYGKWFYSDGSIQEGDMDRGGDLINGFRWELKDDKSHDKFKVTDEEEEENVFICNEKIS